MNEHQKSLIEFSKINTITKKDATLKPSIVSKI